MLWYCTNCDNYEGCEAGWTESCDLSPGLWSLLKPGRVQEKVLSCHYQSIITRIIIIIVPHLSLTTTILI